MASPVKQRVQAFEKHAITQHMTPEKGKLASLSSKFVCLIFFHKPFFLVIFFFI